MSQNNEKHKVKSESAAKDILFELRILVKDFVQTYKFWRLTAYVPFANSIISVFKFTSLLIKYCCSLQLPRPKENET